MENIPLSRRAILARQHANIESPSDLADKVTKLTGVQMFEAEVLAIETGQVEVSSRLVHVAVACGVRPPWLVMGMGAMLEGGAESDLENASYATSRAERALIDGYRHLPPGSQKNIREIVQTMALPMDPNYQAFEAGERSNNEKRRQ